jgi:hypothetical protein
MKKILLTLSLFASMSCFAQANWGPTGFSDFFDDGTVEATAEFGWYNTNSSATYAVTETGGKLNVAVTNADKFFNGFGMYGKPTTAVDLSSGRTLTVDITNTSATNTIKVRIDAKFVVSGFFNAGTMTNSELISAGDTISANKNSSDASYEITIAPNTTSTATFNYVGAKYEYDADGGPWSPSLYTINDFSKFAGFYIVVNGGATESWCSAPANNVCDLFTGTVQFDNLVIGTVTSTNEASSIASSKLFPNPATSEATLNLELKSNSNVKVVVSDVLGKEMMTVVDGNFSSVSKTFSTEALNAGVYNVTYYVNGSAAKTELLMKK